MLSRLTLAILSLIMLALPAAAWRGDTQPTPPSAQELYADRAYAEAARAVAGVAGNVIPYDAVFDLDRSQDRFATARTTYLDLCAQRDLPQDQWARNCYKAAEMFRRGLGLSQDYRQARELYTAACLDGAHIEACLQQAHLSHVGRDIREAPQDYPLARRLYTRACSLDSPSGCAGLGNMLYRGQGGEQDRTRGSRLLQQACRNEYDWACQRLRVFGLPETLEKF